MAMAMAMVTVKRTVIMAMLHHRDGDAEGGATAAAADN